MAVRWRRICGGSLVDEGGNAGWAVVKG